ncbi:glycoside hydrolase family 3 N-terminal domain-containing protein [Kribbella sp. CA-293567]|uniref:glycoside hydrolase family 3 N-terminal domain-containing protein n=1 Tax=Kribbella sp. CA-293567 TaxID=3002436 RepID=UPI0022DE661A|nr:glycoside hydrolase family 3 N-terminal domain-containing protein [Kribbella sp. CA-293567]WBQ06204.1 glycoside hydrolase family 3 C-terminal domain-containing protein [Kribbella sp. CA-293567]
MPRWPGFRPPRRRTTLITVAALVTGLLPLGVAAQAAADDPEPTVLAAFEGAEPFASPPNPGIFGWGSDADDPPTMELQERADAPVGSKVLHGKYDISGWGGFSHDVTFDQNPGNWSAHKGIRFWWYGQNTAPLPPGSGKRIAFEIKDGGANAEASELWNTSFTDDWEGWHLVEIPFSELSYRGDYQPVGGIDQILNLTQMWGYAFTMPGGAPGEFAIDQVEVYGKADPALKASIVTDAGVYPVKEGGTAKVNISLSTTGGLPLDEPVTVEYRTGTGSAGTGDYSPVSGAFTFPAGTPSGASQVVKVITKRDTTAEVAETIPFELTVTGAKAPAVTPQVVVNAHDLPYLNAALPVQTRVADLLGRMTLAEKVGQMTQAERNALKAKSDIATYALGSLLSGGGSVPTPNTPAAWAAMIDSFQLNAQATRLQVPLIYGVDAVHGHNNVIGATILPHNIGIGATHDADLARKTGEVTATEVRATGIPWDFAPCVCVVRDDRWGRSYEGFSEDPALVKVMASVITGMQGKADGSELGQYKRVLASAKHYVGDGGTTYGSSGTGSYKIDQGITKVTQKQLEDIHLSPFQTSVDLGVGTVMPSYSSVEILDDNGGTVSPPLKMHGHDALINGTLKQKMGFEGFVISDWQAIDQLPGDYPSDIRTSINAGLDMIMVPTNYQGFTQGLTDEVTAGRVSQARIDDAVSRILVQKFRLGLFERPYSDPTRLGSVGSPAHRAVGREAAAKSQVLLKNDGNLLPLAPTAKVYVAGGNANDLGNQLGGWSISWQGGSGSTTTGTTILDGIKQVAPTATFSQDASAPTDGHDVGVVVVGEKPYAEGIGDVGNNGHTLGLNAGDKAAVEKVCAAMKCVVLVVSGRPQVIADQLGQINALVASWLPGTEGAGVADVLFGKRPFSGRLPVTWAKSEAQQPINVGDAAYDPQYPYGWGLTTQAAARENVSDTRRDLLRRAPADPNVVLAAAALDQALKVKDWSGPQATTALAALGQAGKYLQLTSVDTSNEDDAVVAGARWIAQDQIGQNLDEATSKLTADAEHLAFSGDLTNAIAKLTAAYNLK